MQHGLFQKHEQKTILNFFFSERDLNFVVNRVGTSWNLIPCDKL